MDNDDTLDVVATACNANEVVWYEAPSWTKHFIDHNLNGAYDVYVADMDGDNNLDVVATGATADDVVWYEAPFWTKHFIDPDLDGAACVYVADMDDDNDLDVVATGATADDVVWYEAPFWTKHFIDPDLDGAYSVFVADMDDDNDLDVVAGGYNADNIVWYENPLGIEEEIASNQPNVIGLSQPFPNPFSEKTDIRYQIPDNSIVSLKIYDATGRLVKQWDNTTIQQSGHVIWDGRNNFGKRVPTGVYFLKLSTEQFSTTKQLLLVK
jgi:hypothetical protein